jgi:hypothetical protein
MARFEGFVAGSYRSRAFQADAERSINWYPEMIEVPGGRTKTNYVLLSRPGLKQFARVASASAIRAEAELNGRAWFIAEQGANNVFYELRADGSTTSYGTIPGDRRPQIVPGQTQLLILSGGLGYGFDLVSSTLTRITAADFPIGAIKAGESDGFFIVLEPNSQVFAISDINDVFSWNALDFGDVEGEPGNVNTFVVDHRQLWFFGNNHSEVFYDSGSADFPFTRLDGAYMEQGACGVDAAFPCDNSVFWLGQNRDGQGVAWRASGYTPLRISTHAIEALISTFGSDLSRVSGYCYQEDGHTFARWDFPDAHAGRGHSLLYDVGEKYWHERAFWNATLGKYMADLARTHMFAFGRHLVGDWRSGAIYEQSLDYKSDNGAAIRRLRAAPDLANGGKWTFYDELRLLMDVGVGLDGGITSLYPTQQMNLYPIASDDVTLNAGASGTFTWNFSPFPWPTGTPLTWPISTLGLLSGGIFGFDTWTIDVTLEVTLAGFGSWIFTISGGSAAGGVILSPPVTLSTPIPMPASSASFSYRVLSYAATNVTQALVQLRVSQLKAPAPLPVFAGLVFENSVGDYKVGVGTSSQALTFGSLTLQLVAVQYNSAGSFGSIVLPIPLHLIPPSNQSFSVTLTANGISYGPVRLADQPVTIALNAPVTIAPYSTAFTIDSGDLVLGTFVLIAIQPGPSGAVDTSNIPADGAPAGDGSDPQIALQASNDGGKTWSQERTVSMGKLGDYKKLVRWSRLGRSLNRGFRVICSEPVDASLISCELDTHGFE